MYQVLENLWSDVPTLFFISYHCELGSASETHYAVLVVLGRSLDARPHRAQTFDDSLAGCAFSLGIQSCTARPSGR